MNVKRVLMHLAMLYLIINLYYLILKKRHILILFQL